MLNIKCGAGDDAGGYGGGEKIREPFCPLLFLLFFPNFFPKDTFSSFFFLFFFVSPLSFSISPQTHNTVSHSLTGYAYRALWFVSSKYNKKDRFSLSSILIGRSQR